MKLVALGVAVVLLLTCNGFGGHARSVAPRVTSLYKSIGEAKQKSVGDIWSDCSEFINNSGLKAFMNHAKNNRNSPPVWYIDLLQ
jgi:hypothetical protein